MRCPKCGGRTISEDVHTYLGQQLERKCISCGKRFLDQSAPSDQSEENTAAAAAQKEEEPMAGKKATCVDCKRPDMAIVAKGRCGKCYSTARQTGAITVIPKPRAKVEDSKHLSPPPAPPVPAQEPAAKSDILPAQEILAPEAAAAPPAADDTMDMLTFNTPRDLQLLQQLEAAADSNRRTLANEILWRLEASFKTAA